jgi:hypothetical protein
VEDEPDTTAPTVAHFQIPRRGAVLGSLLPCIPTRAGVGREDRCSVARSIRLNT